MRLHAHRCAAGRTDRGDVAIEGACFSFGSSAFWKSRLTTELGSFSLKAKRSNTLKRCVPPVLVSALLCRYSTVGGTVTTKSIVLPSVATITPLGKMFGLLPKSLGSELVL